MRKSTWKKMKTKKQKQKTKNNYHSSTTSCLLSWSIVPKFQHSYINIWQQQEANEENQIKQQMKVWFLQHIFSKCNKFDAISTKYANEGNNLQEMKMLYKNISILFNNCILLYYINNIICLV